MRPVPIVFLAASIQLLAFAIGPATAEDIITGTATYELSLDSSKAGAVGSVSGRMIQSIRRSCEPMRFRAKSPPTWQPPMAQDCLSA